MKGQYNIEERKYYSAYKYQKNDIIIGNKY